MLNFGIAKFEIKIIPSHTLKNNDSSSDDRLSFAIEAAELGTWDYNPITNNLTVNSRLKNWFGLAATDNLTLETAVDRIIPSDRARVLAAIEQALQYGSPGYDIEYSIQNPFDSKLRIIRVKGKASFDDNHAAYRFDGIMQDVTDQINAVNKIKKNEEKLRSVVESAPFPIAVYIGEELIIEIANKSIIDTWGKGDDVIGKRFGDLLPELWSQGIVAQILKVFKTGKALHTKNEKVDLMIGNQLVTHYFNYSFTPLYKADGTVYGVMNTAADVTQQNLTAQQIQKSEQRFRTLILAAPVGIGLLVGPDFIIETHNSTFVDIVGKGNDIKDRMLREVMPELITEENSLLNILDDVYRTGKMYQHFGRQINIVRQGVMTSNYYDFTYTPIFGPDGKVEAILDIVSDVTDNIKAQQKILESEQSLRNTILHAPVAMCIFRGPEYVVQIANIKMLEFWGKTADDIIGKPIFEGLPESINQGFEELLHKVFTSGETVKAHDVPATLNRGGKLQLVYTDFVYEPYKEDDGRITGILAVAIDVTQQVMARKKIEEAEARARLAIESADLGVYEVNLEDNSLIASPRFHEIWGSQLNVSRAELTQKIHPDDVRLREKAHKDAFKTGNLSYEARIIKSDNTSTWFRAKGKILKDETDKPATLIGVIQDITEQKEFAEQLTRLVHQRTVELRRSNEDLQQFAHVASHDLKEPVRKIKFYSNLIQDQFACILPEKGLSHLQKIHHATDRMFSMIDGVLKYSAMRAIDQAAEPVSLSEVFDNIESDLEILMTQKNALISRTELPQIEGAPVLIYQLFYNIVNNALKFSSTSEQPVIVVTSEIVEMDNGQFVKVRLADNGIGFDPNYISTIFHPFARLNPKDKYEGTGLGLALCKKIAEQHHGFIDADGAPGNGAVFTVTLPLLQRGKLYKQPV